MHAPLSCYQLTPQLRYLYIIISSGMQPAALCYTVMLCITSCGVKVCGLPRCRVSSLSPAALSYIISCGVQVCSLLHAPLSYNQLIPSCTILYNQLWCAGVRSVACPAVVLSADPPAALSLYNNQQWYAASCAMLYSYVMYNQLWCEGVRPAPLSCKQLIPSCAILYNQLWCAGVQPAARPAVVQSADPQLHYLI